MRICILNDNFYRGSGITLVIKRLAESPGFAGVDIFLAGCSVLEGHSSFGEDTSFVPSGHYHAFPMMSTGIALLPALWRFARWLRRIDCDLIHVHHRRLAALAHLLVPFTRVPVVFTGHRTFPNALWFRVFAPPVMTGVSPSVVDYLRRCSASNDISVIYNPFEFPNANPAKSSQQTKRRVISVGRLDPIKDHATLIEAWSLLMRRGAAPSLEIKLDIFGEGPLRGAILQGIRDRNLEDSVTLHGFVDDLSTRLDAYSFNVLVSEKEGLPNVVVEAASRGLPTLLTDVDGSRDTLPETLALPNGIEFGNAEMLTDALARWLASPDLVADDGQRFFDSLAALCSPTTIAAQYRSLFERVLRDKLHAQE